jgi:predicted nuclease of predicted toxin-antitoxin system
VKCLIDHQLPPALARFLAERGVDSEHVNELGLAEATDTEIWNLAANGGYVLISKDQDFFEIASRSKSARLIWVRIGNCRKRVLLEAFEKLWFEIEGAFADGEQIVEIR